MLCFNLSPIKVFFAPILIKSAICGDDEPDDASRLFPRQPPLLCSPPVRGYPGLFCTTGKHDWPQLGQLQPTLISGTNWGQGLWEQPSSFSAHYTRQPGRRIKALMKQMDSQELLELGWLCDTANFFSHCLIPSTYRSSIVDTVMEIFSWLKQHFYVRSLRHILRIIDVAFLNSCCAVSFSTSCCISASPSVIK